MASSRVAAVVILTFREEGKKRRRKKKLLIFAVAGNAAVRGGSKVHLRLSCFSSVRMQIRATVYSLHLYPVNYLITEAITQKQLC